MPLKQNQLMVKDWIWIFFLPVFHEEYEAENHWDEEDFETVFDVDDDEMLKMITKHCSVLCHHI